MTITVENAATLTPAHNLTHGVEETRTINRSGQTLTQSTIDQVMRLAFSPDSRLLATGGRVIRLWDIASGQVVNTVTAPEKRVHRLAFARDGEWIAVWSGGRVEVREAGGQAAVRHTLELADQEVADAACTPDGRIVAVHTTPDQRSLRLMDVRSGSEIAQFDLPEPATAVIFSSDGRQLLALTTLGLMRLWHATQGILSMEVLIKFTAEVMYLGCSADGQLIATRMRDGSTVQVWDIATGTAHGPALPIVLAHEVTFSPDKRLVAISSTRSNAGIELRDVRTGALLHTIGGSYPAVFSPDGAWLACGAASAGQGHAVRLFAAGRKVESEVRARPGQSITISSARQAGNLAVLRGHSLPVNCVAISQDGRWIASGSADQTIRIWHSGSGETVLTLRQHGDPVNGLAFSADGRRLVSGSGSPGSRGDSSVRVFALEAADDALTADETLVFQGHDHCVTSVDLSPDGELVASTDTAGSLLLWDVASGRIHHRISHAAPVNDVAFSPDGRLIAAAVGGETERGYWDADNSVRLWDVASGQLYAVLKRHRDWVMRAVFSPDGRIAAAIDHRRRLYGWEIDSQQVVLDQTGSTAIALTRSDELAAVAHHSVIQLLNPQSGAIIAELVGHQDRINQLAFTPDSTLLVSASDDGTVRLWGIPQPGQSVISPIAEPAEAAPAAFALRLIELRCLRGQERDGDEVYLRLNDHTIWDVQRFGRRMSHHLDGRGFSTAFNFRDCTYDTPQGRARTSQYQPDDFIITGLEEPARLQLLEADSFLRGGDDLLGEIIIQAGAAQWDEVECDFDRGGAHYRLTYAVIAEPR
ncbi:MAG TPA: hypothetical protein VKY59_08380 [Spirillospora sp.]|nr:hypothetical protein [Spirillospora sp.]